MTVINVMTIQGNKDNIKVSSAEVAGKWMGYIDLFKDGTFYRTLLSSNPIFDSEEECLKKMNQHVQEVQDMDLSKCLGE